MKNLKYWKQCLKLKSIKSDYQKGQIGRYASIGFPVRSGLTLRLRIQIRYKKYEKSQLKNKYWKKIAKIRSKKSGHVSGYVARERGATISLYN